jgi:uncharacterized protein YfaS (alpha-2-macroglobulin family)
MRYCSIALLLVAGCGSPAKPKPGDQPSPVIASQTIDSPSTPENAGANATAAIGPASLDPVIREVGEAGILPTRIQVELARPVAVIVDQDNRRGRDDYDEGDEEAGTEPKLHDAGGTVLRVVAGGKPVRGKLGFPSRSTLTFIPDEPFPYDSQITATLEKIQTKDGVVTPPAGTTWVRSFNTPKFGLARVEYGDTSNKVIDVRLVFTGAVEPLTVKATFSLNGEPTTVSAIDETDQKNVLRARMANPSGKTPEKIQYRLAAGARPITKGKATAAEVSGTVTIPQDDGGQVDVLAAYVGEGTSGHYLQVICRDEAENTGRDEYFYDNVAHESFNVTRRCLLASAKEIELTPKAGPISITQTRGGFRIFGKFSRGPYNLKIRNGARTVAGGALHQTFSKELLVNARTPTINFLAQGRYLPRGAWKSLAVRHVNVDNALFEIRQIPVANLAFWLSGDDDENATDRNADLLVHTNVRLPAKVDASTLSWIDLEKLLPDRKHGVYELSIATDADSRKTDKRRLLFTDLNLIAKSEASGKTWVWAIDINTLAPISGVRMKSIVRSGRVLAQCTTDGRGACQFDAPKKDAVDTAAPFAIVAERGDDVTYLRYQDLRASVSDDVVQGAPYHDETPYRAAIYSDRGVYRPGETAHLAALIREPSGAAPKAGIPVTMKLLDPRTKVTKKQVLRTNEAGALTTDLSFDDYADTGKYKVTLAIGDKPVGEYPFNVEEFVPERMKVTAKAVRPAYRLNEEVGLTINARYLFGGSAEGAGYEVTCELSPSTFKLAKFPKFEFGVFREEDASDDDNKPQKPIAVDNVKGQLEKDGLAKARCASLGDNPAFAGPARLTAKVAVMEAGSGRTTQTDLTVPIHPEKYYLGLSTSVKTAESGKAFPVEGMVVDWDGNPVTTVSKVEVDIVHLEVEYDWSYDGGDYRSRFRRMFRQVTEGSQTATVTDGKFNFTVTPQANATAFLVRAHAGHAQTDLRVEGSGDYWWWSSDGRDGTPKPQRPTGIDVKLPASIGIGEKTAVKFEAPFKGRALITVESDEVISQEWVEVAAGPNEWSFTLAKFVPNVYVSVLLVKDPRLEAKTAFLPDRAFGVRSVRVEPKEFTQSVSIDVPKEIRSGSKLTVKLDLGATDGPTTLTVAAVDQGILQLTKFKPPDPLALIFAQRALGVSTFETVGWNVSLPASAKSPGGDADEDGSPDKPDKPGGRVQPVKPVALWSGQVQVGSDGKATVSFDVPTYRGALTVMAVSASPKRMGHAAAEVLVRDPLTIETTMPRFLAKDDLIEVPVFVTNLSGQKRDVDVQLVAAPFWGDSASDGGGLENDLPLEVVGEKVRHLKLADQGAGRAIFQVRAKQAIGGAKIKVEAKSGDLSSKEELQLPLLPPAPRTRTVQRVELAAGTTDVSQYLKGWLPTTEKSTFWVTSNPYGDAFSHLGYLIHYPYGCIEQTTSSTRPLLFVGSLVESSDPSATVSQNIPDMVMSGIRRVFSMQTPSGGFAYWPGGTSPNEWGTAYATHMLIDAQRMKYAVPEDRLHDALDYLERTLTQYEQSWHSDYYRYWYNHHDEPYMHYVLALAGRGRKARIEKLIDSLKKATDGEEREDLYLLEAALYLTGDRRYENELKHPDVTRLEIYRANNWYYYSDLRRRGLELSVFADLFGDDPAGDALAGIVADGMRDHTSYWYTTQELVWGITGLGKRLAKISHDFSPATLTANGKKVAPKNPREKRPANAQNDRSWSLPRASEYKALQIDLPKKDSGRVFLIINSEGIRKSGTFPTGGDGLSIDRTFKNSDGTTLNLGDGSISLGDVVVVQVEIENRTGEPIQNIALVDRFPAGFEVENPRLGRSAAMDWIKPDDQWNLDNMNIRDDRIEVFGALSRLEKRTVVYALRATVAGHFALPPVEAEAMYNPAVWARDAGGKAVVSAPWEPR